ncbi:MAG: M48 family metalloprotease [Syntrophorhabdales bacterium]|jgi:predicted Zn-dependent protease
MKLRHAVAILLLFFFPSSLLALTLDEEKKYGRQVYVEISKSTGLYADPYASIYMGIIKTRLESAADLPLSIKLTIIESSTLDAFATVGGYVFMTTGLMEQADKEEEIAGVLGHEFGHVGKRHVAKTLEKEKFLSWATVAAMLLSLLAPDPNAKAALMASGMGAGQTVALGYSRQNEDEADMAGVATTEKAGYSGLGSAEFLKKIMTGDEKNVPQYLLTHPYSADRVIRIEERAAKPARTRVDDSLFPFLLARLNIVGKPLSPQKEEIWLNRYRKNPKDPVSAYAAALVYTIKGDNKKALDLLSNIDFPYRPLFLGEFYVNCNRYNEAVEVLSEQSHPIARFYLAKAYEGQGNLAMAGQIYKELIPYASTYPEIYQRIAMASGRQGDEGGGYEYLGRYFLETGKDVPAKINLEKAIAKYGINAPESEELLMLLDTIPGQKKKTEANKG